MTQFVSAFDIPVRLGSLFQWKTFVNDRFHCSCLNKVPEESEVLRVPTHRPWHPEDNLFSIPQRGPLPSYYL
jgi:hypothetical protein